MEIYLYYLNGKIMDFFSIASSSQDPQTPNQLEIIKGTWRKEIRAEYLDSTGT